MLENNFVVKFKILLLYIAINYIIRLFLRILIKRKYRKINNNLTLSRTAVIKSVLKDTIKDIFIKL